MEAAVPVLSPNWKQVQWALRALVFRSTRYGNSLLHLNSDRLSDLTVSQMRTCFAFERSGHIHQRVIPSAMLSTMPFAATWRLLQPRFGTVAVYVMTVAVACAVRGSPRAERLVSASELCGLAV
jgi:hypothetical protein